MSYTEDEAKAYYDEQLTEQQAKIDEDASNYASYSSGISVYRPQGSRFIKNLLIGLPEDAQSQISNLRKSGDDAVSYTHLDVYKRQRSRCLNGPPTHANVLCWKALARRRRGLINREYRLRFGKGR